MKSTELKNMIKEAVKEAIQEELKDILLEAVKAPKASTVAVVQESPQQIPLGVNAVKIGESLQLKPKFGKGTKGVSLTHFRNRVGLYLGEIFFCSIEYTYRL